MTTSQGTEGEGTQPTDPQAPADPPAEEPQGDGLEELPEDETVSLRTIRERNRELRALRERQAQQDAELEQLRQERMSEHERALEAARKEGYETAASEFGQQLLQERVAAVAATTLNDPEDAIRYLPLDQMSGATREDIGKAIAALIEERPYLAKQDEPAPNQWPFDGGPRGQGPPNKKQGDDFVRGLFGR